ncbi:MAG: hypothetical protein ACRC2T_08395, partial [Thermoguttaceae bacterium]
VVLSPELLQLGKQIQAALTAGTKRPLSIQSNTPSELIAFSFVYGADTRAFSGQAIDRRQQNAQNGKDRQGLVYAIGSLCWNYPSAGQMLLRTDGKHVIPRVGVGVQRKPAEFLALLAMSSVADTYELKVGNSDFTVDDLVSYEKANCSQGADMSLALVGLSFYCDCEEEWTNDFGEKWSIQKMVYSELMRPTDQGTCDITDQLVGLSAAVNRFEIDDVPLTGTMLEAKKYLDAYAEFALTAQNEQGLWHPQFFLYKGTTTNNWDALYAGGHIFRFLAFQLPDEKLNDPRVVKAANALVGLLNRVITSPTTTQRENESIAVALHALALYQQRLGLQEK